jgi:hypothetical protein
MTAVTYIFAIQIKEDLPSQLMMEYMEMTFLLIFISVAIFIIIATPVVLFYFALDNYFKFKVSKNLINKDLFCKNNLIHSTYVSQIYDQYKISFTKFISNISALLAWNVFSVIYISVYFTNFKTGIYSYFLSPFEIIESISMNNSIDTLSQFKTKGIYMLGIFTMSLIFFQIGKSIAQFLLRNNLLYSLKDKLSATNSQLEPTILEV